MYNIENLKMSREISYLRFLVLIHWIWDGLADQTNLQTAPSIFISLASENSFEVKNDETNARVFFTSSLGDPLFSLLYFHKIRKIMTMAFSETKK